MGRLIDLTGMKFGRWSVLVLHPERARYGSRTVHVLWLCRCNCGAEHLVTTSGLRSGHTTQCGTCRREQLREQLSKRGTHGMSRARAFCCWANMLQRCLNPNHPSYDNYGGRGITVCEDWRSFENFYADMLDPPPGLSIDRIDVNGNYEPANCRWADTATQAVNRRPRKQKARRAKLEDVRAYAASLARAASASTQGEQQ